MNDLRPQQLAPSDDGIRTKPGIPLDVAILAIRVLEFVTVGVTGLAAIVILADTLGAGNDGLYGRVVLIAAIAYGVLAESLGCYDIDAQFSLRQAWRRVAGTWMTVALFMVTLGFLLKASDEVSRSWALSWFLGGGAILLLVRASSTFWVRHLKARGTFNERVAIFGAGAQGQRFAQYVQSHDRLTITLVGFFDDRQDGRVPGNASDVPMLGNLSTLIGMIREGRLDQVVVALPWSAEKRLQEIVSRLALTPVKIRLAPDLASFAFAQRPVVLLGEVPVMTLFERPISGFDAAVKAAEDQILTIIIIAVIWPLLLLIAIAVRLDSPGPVLFRQPREGFNNRSFQCFKFRTMYHEHGQLDDIRQASRDDDRITRIGRILRRLSLDELPQLFNVLTGDMSLVGPRPHATSTRAGGRLFSEVVISYAARHKVKPGITGWAQVCGWRGETDTEEKLVKRLEHDLYYIENWSLWLDIYILMRTVGAVLLPRNAF
ncbi:undecaprenyl-phosphate glucose phosphotransferase [Sandarakinorhabdus sp.]|uniref:undecaprenyl-phosphate glucose phosphotransferase n=1 Tax=Sandarakinorhabdus sp. TaxID=1916663 RepID=UPI00286E5475|nr:undecaprenyl-phosphate glucose phosphotransferase [Sandarakinorhabdus sp.]